jgi:hypothetical protein
MLCPHELVIDDSVPFTHPVMNEGFKGQVPRDPVHVYGNAPLPPSGINLIPWKEIAERIRDLVAAKAQLSDIRERGNFGQRIPSYDQNGQGYCWMYAVVIAMALLRAKMGLPYKRLSAHGPACKVKNFRDEGGWGALALDFVSQHGVPTISEWPEKSMSRSYDTPATWEAAAKNKITSAWVDITAPVYNRDLSFQQVLSLLVTNTPVVADFDHWGHAVCLCDAVDAYPNLDPADPNRYGVRLWNSWTDSWGTNGMGVLTQSKARPSNAVAPLTASAS